MSASAQKSSSGIGSRIVRAAGAQGVNQLARVGQLFLLVPICLGTWGTAAYEDWLLVNAIAGLLVLADMGLVQYTTVKLIEAWSREEQERFSREWAVSLGLFASLSLALICLLGVFWAEPAWTSLLAARELQPRALASAAVLMSLGQVFLTLFTLGLAAYRARLDLSRSYHASSILVALQTAGIAIPPLLGGGPVASAAGYCSVTGVMLVAVTADLRLRYPDLVWRPIWPSYKEMCRAVYSSFGYLASPMAISVTTNGPPLILAHIGVPEGAIALFTTTRTIAGVARQLPYQFAHPTGVELAGLLARGDREGLSRVYASAGRALAVIVGMLGGFTLVAGPLVMLLWTRGDVSYDPILMLLMVGATVVCAPAQVAYTLLWYGGYPGRLSKALIASTGFSVGLAIILGLWFETRGVAAGFGLGEILGIAVYLSLVVDRLLERKAGTGLLRNFWIAVLALLSSAASAYLLDRLIEPHGWLGLVALGAAWTGPAAVSAYWTLLSRPQQVRVVGAITGFARSAKSRAPVKNANSADLG